MIPVALHYRPANRQPEEEDIDKAEALIMKVRQLRSPLPLFKNIS